MLFNVNIIIIIIAALYCKHVAISLKCSDKNPVVINGTQLPEELRCPRQCKCQYCAPADNPWEYKHYVDCSYRQLKTVPILDSVPTDARYYNLTGNEIESLKNNSFESSPDLEYLNLGGSKMSYKKIDTDAFKGLRKLTFLSMNKNLQLYQVHAWFNDLISLEILHLKGCGLTTIESDVFKYCKKLQKIDLSWNAITSLPATVFQNLPVLNYIYINNNRLTNIPNHAYRGSPEIKQIVISDNQLSTISENVGLQNLSQLQLMEISYNPFECDCDIVWFVNWIHTTNVSKGYQYAQCKKPTRWHKTKLIDFNPEKLQCNKVIWILKIAIPSTTAAIILVLIGSLLYYFRYDIRYWKQRRRLRKQYERIDNEGPPPINGENIVYDVFVAYNNKDQQWVLKVLQPSLEEQRNFKMCVDYRDFVPGEAVVNNIANAVKYSRKVLLIVSKNFAKSEWCYFELEMARMRMFDNHEDILVIVLLEKVSAKDMPILLHKILTEKTYIEWEEHPERQALFWTKLEAALLSPNCPRNRLLDNNS